MKFTCKDTCSAKDIQNNFCNKFGKDVTYGKCEECVLVIKMVAERGGYTRIINKKNKTNKVVANKEIVEQVTKEVLNMTLWLSRAVEVAFLYKTRILLKYGRG